MDFLVLSSVSWIVCDYGMRVGLLLVFVYAIRALPLKQLSFSETDISSRLQSFSDFLLSKRFEGQSIAVVGHSLFFRLFLNTKTKMKNCGVVQTHFNVDTGNWEADLSLCEDQFNLL